MDFLDMSIDRGVTVRSVVGAKSRHRVEVLLSSLIFSKKKI